MARRESGSGSIYRRADRDGWWVSVAVRDAHGRRRRVVRRGGDTLREARIILGKLKKTTEDRAKGVRPGATLAEYLVHEYRRHLKAQVAPHSYVSDRGRLNRAAKWLGPRPMHSVQVSLARKLLNDIRGGWEPPEKDKHGRLVPQKRAQRGRDTVKKYCSALSMCWKHAQEAGVVDHNPWAGIRLPSAKGRTVPYLEESELADFYSKFEPRYRPFVTFLGETAARRGEALRVRWKDVYTDADLPHVMFQGKNGEVRPVPLRPLARAALEELRERAGDAAAAEARVFTELGATWHKAAQEAWTAAVKAFGRGHLTPHSLRHARACLLVRAGIPIVDVARWLGHKDGGVLVLKRYGHHAPEDHLARALRMSLGKPKAAEA